MRLIIDTDAGIDDAQALMLALAHPNATVEAITAVTGNVHINHVVPNVMTTLDAMGADVPVYRGLDRPVIADWNNAEEFHGADGLGDYTNRPPVTKEVEAEHAVNALIRMVNEAPGELTLVTLGPLSNIAMAVRLDPTLPEKIKHFVLMGGTIAGTGNTREFIGAEFNIACDPDAAHVVLDAFPQATMLSWETTLDHGVPWDQFDELLAIDTRRGRFFRDISAKLAERMRREYDFSEYLIPDPLAMAITLEPSLIMESETYHMVVERFGQHTRGQTVIDHLDFMEQPPNVTAVTALDIEGVLEMFRQTLSYAD